MDADLCHQLLTTTQAAKLLGITAREMSELRRTKAGPDWINLGRTIRYIPDDLNWWLNLRADV